MDNKIFACIVDLETTGLDAQSDVPLEIGARFIDKFGIQIGSRFDSLVFESDNPYFMKAVQRGKDHKFVGPMHTENGLWDELHQTVVDYPRAYLDELISDWFTDNEVKFGTVPLMGNSIGSLDRPFIIAHFPMFNAALHYRNIDVSTIKESVKALNPGLFENLKPIIGTKEDADHRTQGDIDACIREWQAYIEDFFMLGEEEWNEYIQ